MSSATEHKIHELIEAKDFATLKTVVSEGEVHDLAELMGDLADEDRAIAFRLLPQDIAAKIFGEFEIEQQEEMLRNLSSEKVAGILNEMPPDDRTELLEELPGELAQRLLSALRGDEATVARNLLAYPEDSIGRLMTPEYVAVRPDRTIEQVFAHIRQVAPTKETLNVMYVVDEHSKLLDEMPLEELVLAEPSAKVGDLMDEQFVALQATDDREASIEEFKKYDAVAMPVVDRRGVLVGIVTVDDVLDVAEEEVTEDFQKVTGMAALESSYFATGFWGMLRKRLPWLMLLLVAQMLTAVTLLGFEKLPLFAVLIIFMPLINSPAGNTGSQTAGLMIRGLAVQEIKLGDWWRVLLRELLRGLTLGVSLAVLGFAAAKVLSSYSDRVSPDQVTQIAFAVCLAIVTAVSLANIIGSMLPFFFKRVGLDPAVTSGPFIASLMDVSGIVIYFSIATALLATLS
ncbi:MAG: magnesium transporter [Planctomycetota bacterium]|nr:magnesium transporter [Planctomycetota bacterium]